jgi:nucleoside-diphosphate-sugar epimerase
MTSEKVLVTGGGGFIGSHLIPKLVELDYDVYSLDRYVTGRYVLGSQRAVKTVFCNLNDYFSVRKNIRDIKPEYIIHLAALSAVSFSYDHPLEVLETNFLGTVKLAEACLQEVSHFKHFLFAGTSEEYGNQAHVPINENAELHPNSPYAVSKVAADKYLQYLHDAYDFPVTIFRNFNTHGRKKNTHFVVERTIVQMLKGERVLLGDPTPVRDFMYVDDHVNAYLTCLGNENAIGEVFNFCTSRGVSIEELALNIKKFTDFQGEIIWNTIPARPLDIHVLIGDNSKAKKLLDWSPTYTLEEGLQKSIDYWKTKLES